MTKTRTLKSAAICAALLIAGAGISQAAVCSVPSGPYPTIQSAAIDGTCGTINVAPGVYNENVTVTHSCDINGAQAGIPFAGRTSGGPGESTVRSVTTVGNSATIAITATDVMIDGFSIQNNSNTLGAAQGVSVSGAGNGAGIVNNIFDLISTPDTGGNGTAQAVYLTSSGPDDVNIENNEMKNIHSNRSAKGVLIGDNGLLNNPSQNVQIKGNSMHNITSEAKGAYGVSVASVPNVSGLKVVENKISSMTGGWVHCVGLEGDTPGAMILNNDMTGLTTGPDAVGVWFESNPSFSTVQVRNNNFNLPATQFGIAVHPALTGGSVDGGCNWWNSPTGPTVASNPGGTGAMVTASVTYNPWLIAPAPGGSCFGGNVPANANQCKSGGWMTRTRADGSTFKNQGDCIQYVNTGH